ncbi:MAG: hypothetical protein LC104_18835 [Bacteroidales bacterium]|nr:hypothetical protein [Bacteroidales bacterium]
MAQWWALIVAIEDGAESGFGTMPYALAGAENLTKTLEQAGIDNAHQIQILGTRATKNIIASRLRKLRKLVRRGDSILVYWCGRGFSDSESATLLCWDSLADDLPDTAFPLADLVGQLFRCRCASVTLLLEISPIPEMLSLARVPDVLNAAELHNLTQIHDRLAILTAAAGAETPHAAARWKSPIWTHLLCVAFRGPQTGRTGSEPLTVPALQEFIVREIPRCLRQHLEPGAVQTPQLYTSAGSEPILPTLPPRTAGESPGLLDQDQLRRVVFRSETTSRVKDLSGWKKTFDAPTAATASARKFIARLAMTEIKADLDALVSQVREELGTRRKDLAITVTEGMGSLRTPDFEYSLTATLNPEQPAQVIWLREVGGLSNPAFVRGPEWERVFRQPFDQFVFEFVAPIDVPALVDRWEDQLPAHVQLQVDVDATACVVRLDGVSGAITVRRSELIISGRGGSAVGLLELFLAFLQRVGPLEEPRAIPVAPTRRSPAH